MVGISPLQPAERSAGVLICARLSSMKYLLVDGENIKGKIKYVCDQILYVKHPYWHLFDFPKLFRSALGSHTPDRIIFYFAKIKVHPNSVKKSNELILEQRLLKTTLESYGYEVVLSGNVRGNSTPDGKVIFKEKGVDVRIAVDLVSFACDKKANEIILCSSDSDLQPAISEATRRGVAVTYLGFGASPNKGLTYTTKETVLIRDAEVESCIPMTLLSLESN